MEKRTVSRRDYCYKRGYFLAVFAFFLLIFLSFFAVGDSSGEVGDSDLVSDEVSSDGEEDNLGDVSEVENQDSTGDGVKDSFAEDFASVEDGLSNENFYVDLDEILGENVSIEENTPSNESFSNSEEESVNGNLSGSVDENVSADVSDLGVGGSFEEEFEEENYEYLEIDKIVEAKDTSNQTEEKLDLDPGKEIKQVFYKGNRKEMETMVDEGSSIEITKEESIESDEGGWKKEVKVYSEEHHENPVIVYADVVETEEEDIRVYWREEDEFIDFESYDEDENGLTDRISFVAPHLSEQNFDILVDLSLNEDSNATDIVIDAIDVPLASVNVSPIRFGFNVSYYNISAVLCNFSLEDGYGQAIGEDNISEDGLSYVASLSNGNYTWSIDCYDENNLSIEDSLSDDFLIAVNYTPKVRLSLNKQNIDEGDSVIFYVNISAVVESSILYTLGFGDGNSTFDPPTDVREVYREISHAYSDPGNYTIVLTAYVDVEPYIRTESISVDQVSYEDNEAPSITLLDPDDEVISNEEIIFKYKASDNVKLANCTFNLYYYNGSSFGEEVYTRFDGNIAHNENVSIDLVDFDEGDYSWDVGCYDNSTNYKEVGRDFSVEYDNESSNSSVVVLGLNQSFEMQDEIENLISSINDFLVDEEKYSREEKEAVEDLGIIEDLKYYKKKLLQMKLDLSNNLNYIRGDDKREQRKEEIIREIEDMTKKVPVDIEVVKGDEYYKNSLDLDIGGVVRAYIESKGIVLNEGGIKEMVKKNEAIQKYLTVSVKVKQLDIKYYDGESRQSTLVTKEIDFKNESFDSIIEVVPESVAVKPGDISFVNEHDVIKSDSIFEVKLDNLNDGKLVYSILGFVDLDDVEKTSTISFVEDIPRDSLGPITGFATFMGGGVVVGMPTFVFVVVILAIVSVLILFVSSKLKILKWKKQTKVKKLFDLIEETEQALKDKDLGGARNFYHEAANVYPLIPSVCKSYVYKRLHNLQEEIDKKDAGKLLKEFLAFADSGRKEDALEVYGKISAIYYRMSCRHKRKVYEKVLPVIRSFKS